MEVLDALIVPPGPPSWEFSFVRFRVTHRGGAPVRRLLLWSEERYRTFIYAAVDGGELSLLPLLVEREFREGDSLEVKIFYGGAGISSPVDPPLWVGGDALDPFPLNNAARFERPLRIRSRAVARP